MAAVREQVGKLIHVPNTWYMEPQGLLAKRYDAREGTCYLFRPDQHVCARWRAFDLDRVRAAIARATGNVDVGIRREVA